LPEGSDVGTPAALQDATRVEALDRLYRPAALDVPVLVARDAPIASLDPRTSGLFDEPVAPTVNAPVQQQYGLAVNNAITEALSPTLVAGGLSVPRVLEGPAPAVQIVATGETWVRVTSADGRNLFEKVMQKGDTFDVPALEQAPVLRTGQSGAVYFAMNGEFYGPVGGRGSVTSNVQLQQQALAERYEPALPGQDSALETLVAELRAGAATTPTITD